MKKEALGSKLEVFICHHQRENKEDCFHKGAKSLTDELKSWAKENYGQEVKIWRSGCLGKCERGIAVAVYPDRQMLQEVTTGDAQELKECIKKKV